jgi:hypothetical protein
MSKTGQRPSKVARMSGKGFSPFDKVDLQERERSEGQIGVGSVSEVKKEEGRIGSERD